MSNQHTSIVSEYTVLSAISTVEISKLVRLHLEQGWQPVGHAMPVSHASHVHIHQTMVKYKDVG